MTALLLSGSVSVVITFNSFMGLRTDDVLYRAVKKRRMKMKKTRTRSMNLRTALLVLLPQNLPNQLRQERKDLGMMKKRIFLVTMARLRKTVKF